MRLRSGSFAAWAGAWLTGGVAPDDVLDAVRRGDAPHRVSGEHDSLLDVLLAWRKAGARVRLVLPVPGDVRGLPGPAPFRTAALEAGEAVVGGALGLVPSIMDHAPSSAPADVVWQAVAVDTAAADVVSVGEAQQELTEAIRETASALNSAAVGGHAGDVLEGLRDARRAGERLDLPPGFPPRAVALLAQAERLQAVLDLAGTDPLGGAVDRFGASARDAALRPLAAAVRRARVAGYSALA
jgi:hypothetical protein